MLFSNPDQIKKYFLECIELKTPYRDSISNVRHKIRTPNGRVVVTKDDRFPSNELWFVKKVKRDIRDGNLADNPMVKKIQDQMAKDQANPKIKYVDFAANISTNMKWSNCREIDIAAAYWQTAYQLGLINDDVYERAKPMTWEQALADGVITKKQYNKCKGITPGMAWELGIIEYGTLSQVGGISKRIRLVAIGSLAKKTLEVRFTGKRWITLFEGRDPLSFVWDVICYQVSKVMQEAQAACGDDFLMYWVDAMFVKPTAADKVKKVFEKYGYGFKEYKLEKIWTTGDQLFIKSKEKARPLITDGVEGTNDLRSFQLPRINKKAK